MDILRKIFRKSEPKYYIDTIRVWEGNSFDTTLKCMNYAHPMFVIKKRKIFGNDEIVKTFYFTNLIEDALDELRKLNGSDFIQNEKAYRDYEVYSAWSGNTNGKDIIINYANSGVFVRNRE